MKKRSNSNAKSGSSPLICSPRYSFRMPDGRLPMVGGKLSWVGNRKRADIEAKSWGAVAIVVMNQDGSGSWSITEEIPLENVQGHRTGFSPFDAPTSYLHISIFHSESTGSPAAFFIRSAIRSKIRKSRFVKFGFFSTNCTTTIGVLGSINV